jgi:rRNA methylase, putative, group 3
MNLYLISKLNINSLFFFVHNNKIFQGEKMDNLQLEGKNAVLEALNNSKAIDKIMIKKGYAEGSLKSIVAKAKKIGIVVQEVNKNKLDYISQSKNHQGIIALSPAKNYCTVEDILENAKSKNEEPFILILDEISDPRNFGAIIRTAECCAVHGIIIPKHRNSGLTGIVSKTSAGALEHVLIAKVSNLVNTIDKLKKNGLWITCADMNGEIMYNLDFKIPTALIVGSEGFGVGKLIAQNSDFKAKIPMSGKIESLNASVAASILMYEIVRQRTMKGNLNVNSK